MVQRSFFCCVVLVVFSLELALLDAVGGGVCVCVCLMNCTYPPDMGARKSNIRFYDELSPSILARVYYMNDTED